MGKKEQSAYCPMCAGTVNQRGICTRCAAYVGGRGWSVRVEGTDANEVELVAASLSRQRDSILRQSSQFRFDVALSFPGEHRTRVEAIASALAATLGQEKVLYDKWYAAEFARQGYITASLFC